MGGTDRRKRKKKLARAYNWERPPIPQSLSNIGTSPKHKRLDAQKNGD